MLVLQYLKLIDEYSHRHFSTCASGLAPPNCWSMAPWLIMAFGNKWLVIFHQIIDWYRSYVKQQILKLFIFWCVPPPPSSCLTGCFNWQMSATWFPRNIPKEQNYVLYYSLQFQESSVQCTLYFAQYTVFRKQLEPNSVLFTVRNKECSENSIQCPVYGAHYTVPREHW